MTQRLVEVFTASCPLCDETLNLVQELACGSCKVEVRDLREEHITDESREKLIQHGIRRVPAVVVNGTLADCCQSQQSVSREALVAAGIGQV